MVISGLNAGMFAQDFDELLISEVQTPVVIDYTISHPGGQDTLKEFYSPDSSNKIHVRGLGELAMGYFQPLDIVFTDKQVSNNVVTINGSISVDDTTAPVTFTQKFYYSNVRTSIDAYTFLGFLSRYHRRSIFPKQANFVAFLSGEQMLAVGVDYNDKQWKEVQLIANAGSEGVTYQNLSVDQVATLAALPADAKINYFIVYLKKGADIIDAIQFDVNYVRPYTSTDFIYYNCFGVPETLTFTGADKRSLNMDGSFANLAHKYRKIDTKVDIFHDVNSGYIPQITRDAAEDLVQSPRAYLYTDTTLGDEITITEVTFEDVVPRTLPIDVTIVYRVAHKCQRVIDRDMNIDYKIFDHTFGDTFE